MEGARASVEMSQRNVPAVFMRGGASDEELLELIRAVWQRRSDRYSELRGELRRTEPDTKKIEMNYIGG